MPHRRWKSRTLGRYLLLEAPGWAAAAAVLWLCVEFFGLQAPIGLLLLGLWVGKDLVLYPWLRAAYEDADPDATATLVGRIGEARDALDPRGYVRLGPELWRAELQGDQQAVQPGEAVRVRGVRGLTLVVESLRDGGRDGAS